LDSVTQQNASSSEEMASTSEELSSQAEQLQRTISFFKINEDEQKELFIQNETKPAIPRKSFIKETAAVVENQDESIEKKSGAVDHPKPISESRGYSIEMSNAEKNMDEHDAEFEKY